MTSSTIDDYAWRRMPFVRLVIPFIAGILIAIYLEVGWIAGLVLALIGSSIIGVNRLTKDIHWRIQTERWVYPGIILLLLGTAFILVDHRTTHDREEHFANYEEVDYLIGRVQKSPQEKQKTYKLILDIEQGREGEEWKQLVGELLLYAEKSDAVSELEIGDHILIPAEYRAVQGPQNPGEFDYRRFLSFKDIHHQQYVKDGRWSFIESEPGILRTAERIRGYLLERLDRVGMDGREAGIASALLLGKKEDLDPDLTRSYASAGAMHVLAVSGLHVGIIYFIVSWLLQGLFKGSGSHIVRTILLILFLWLYAFVTGLSPSVVRAATMFSAVTLAKGIGRHSDIYNTIASSAFILLAINPFYIMEVGFQLSYVAVIGIIYLHPKIYGWLYFPNTFLDKVWQISCVSIAAQLATFPLGLLYFHQFPTYFLLSNLIVIPAAFLILYVGLAYLLFSWIPWVGDWLGIVLDGMIWGLNQGVVWVQSLPTSLIQGVDISILEVWLIYGILIFGALAFADRWKAGLRLALGMALLFFGLQLSEDLALKSSAYLTVYDVRGGQAVNIISPERNEILCDSVLANAPDRQQFHLQNHWNRLDAPPVRIHPLPKEKNASFIKAMEVDGRSILMVDGVRSLSSDTDSLEVDFLIVGARSRHSLGELLGSVQAETVILDSSWKPWAWEKALEGMPEDLALHIVDRDGYFNARL